MPLEYTLCNADIDDRETAKRIMSDDSIRATSYEERHEDCKRESLAVHRTLELLKACREVHAEAALLPFRENTSVFAFLDDVEEFLLKLVHAQARAVLSIVLVNPYYVAKTREIERKLTGLASLTYFMDLEQLRWTAYTLCNEEGEEGVRLRNAVVPLCTAYDRGRGCV